MNKLTTIVEVFRKSLFVVLAVGCIGSLTAQQDSTRTPTPPGGGRPAAAAAAKPKPYAEVITDKAKTDQGLFKVHTLDDKYFFEIPDSLLGRHILVVNRISKSAADFRSGGFFGYAGDDIGQNVIRFEKGPNNKIFLRNISFSEYAKDSTSSMFTSVTNSNVQPIAQAFDIKAYSKDSTASVIDMTDYINGDNDILFFRSSTKTSNRIGSIQNDKSYTVEVKSFPINIEIVTVKTYGRTPAPPATGAAAAFGIPTGPTGNLTFELNSSMVLLPKEPMQARYYDPRVGFFAVGYTDYDLNPQGVERVSLVKRWRLEPKPEDMEKYKRGELVEPQKPIVFYIDPSTPEKWIPYLIQGVNDWQVAFEKAGFKNAIMGKRAPTKAEDPEWSLADARNSAIVYKPSDTPNASGPSISDPRSGEIMESHINWYHNVMQLLRNWYFVQCAPVDARARKMTFDDELMGQLIRFVSSHEVGHTLGLRHNHGSSSTVPVDSLRSKNWVEANGHTPSIMDYARFNYVAQPEDNISEVGLFPRIGDYDKWAIEWGYRRFLEYPTPVAEKEHLNKWVIEKLKNKRLWFGTETNPDDPRSQSEQVGDDAVKGSVYGIKNLQRIVPKLTEWTKEPNESYEGLRSMYNEVVGQFNRYNGHVSKYVAGIMETPKTVEQPGPVYEIVPEGKQKEAVEHLNKYVFATPTWLLNQDIFTKTGLNGLSVVEGIQSQVLSRLLSARNLNKLVDAEASIGKNAYQVTELLSDLKRGVWTELTTLKPTDVYRRQLQKSYLTTMDRLLNPPAPAAGAATVGFGQAAPVDTDKTDVKAAARAHLSTLKAEINIVLPKVTDQMTRIHLQDMVRRINDTLNPKD